MISYEATLKTTAKTLTGKGDSIIAALNNIENLGNAVVKGILTLVKFEDGKEVNRSEKILAVRNIKLLFSGSRLMREVALKNTSNLFLGM